MLTYTTVSITLIATVASAIEGSFGVLTDSITITSVRLSVTLVKVGAVDAITVITRVAVTKKCSYLVDTRGIAMAGVSVFRALIEI